MRVVTSTGGCRKTERGGKMKRKAQLFGANRRKQEKDRQRLHPQHMQNKYQPGNFTMWNPQEHS